MPIDGCEHSFQELANEVLPGYISTLRENMAHSISMSNFGVKGIGPVTLPPETVALASRVLRYNWTSKEDSWLGRGTQRNRS
jgi:hypothetical protein